MEALVLSLAVGLVWWLASAAKDAMRDENFPPPGRTEFARRLLKHVARRRIADLQDGQAAVIRGRVRAIRGVPLQRAPLSGIPAVGVNVRILDAAGNSLVDHYACSDFELVDDTGSIRVEGKGVDVAIVDVQVRHWSTSSMPHALWLERQAPVPIGLMNSPTIRGTEGVIVEGAEVLVFGMVATDMSAAANYRGASTSRVIRVSPSFPVVVSADRDVFLPGNKAYSVEELIQLKRNS